MKTKLIKITALLIVGISLSLSAQLNVLPLTAIEGQVPSHYDGVYDSMVYTINDSFFYNPGAYYNTNSGTPAPSQPSVGETCFVPLSIPQNIINRGFDTATFWTDYPHANSYIFEFSIPEGQALKYLDIWGRVNAALDWRHQNLVVELYNDDMSCVSGSFNVGSSHDEYPAFKRLNLASLGFTDNLVNLAKGIRIRHTDEKRREFLHLYEIRMVTVNDPYKDLGGKPVLSNLSVGTFKVNDSLSVKSNRNGTIYMVPLGIEDKLSSLQKVNVLKFWAIADSVYELSTAGIDAGDYVFYALDQGANISQASGTTKLEKTVGLKNVQQLNATIYPNPSNQGFEIDIQNSSGLCNLNVFTLSGKQVYHVSLKSGSINHIPGDVFPHPGLYILRITGNRSQYMQKLIVKL